MRIDYWDAVKSALQRVTGTNGALNVNVVGTAGALGTEDATYSTVPVADTGTVLLAADATLKRVTITNNDTAKYVGIFRGNSVGTQTYAKCAVKLAPGDSMIEEYFAGNGQGFYGITQSGESATVAIEKYA